VWRPKIAYGETVSINAPANQAPDGAKEFSADDLLPPLPGLEIILNGPTTVSPWAIFCRVSGAGDLRAHGGQQRRPAMRDQIKRARRHLEQII
jgi:hypothetical protein